MRAEDARSIGIILFSYAAMDVGHFVKEVRQILDAIRQNAGLPLLKFGASIRFHNKIPATSNNTTRWPLKDNQVIMIEAESADAKALAHCLHVLFNKTKNALDRPGHRDIRLLAEPGLTSASKDQANYTNFLIKHKNFMSCLATVIYSSEIIKCCDTPHTFTLDDGRIRTTTLRQLVANTTCPILPPRDPVTGQKCCLDKDGKPRYDKNGELLTPESLFHNMDRNTFAQHSEHEFVFTCPKDRRVLAERVVQALPALVNFLLGE